MRTMKPIYAVMVPQIFPSRGAYTVHDPLFESKEEAEKEAQGLTCLARGSDKSLPECYVRVFALTPSES